MSLQESHQILLYEYVPDILQRRSEHREAHLRHLRESKASGELIAAGAFGDPPSGALLILREDADPESFVKGDPYFAAGLLRSWRAERWTVAVR